MKTAIVILFATVSIALITACGGGSGGGSETVAPVASTLSFSMAGFKNLRKVASSGTFSISGNCVGTGSENSGAAYNTNLYGAAYGQTQVTTLNYTNCTGSGVTTSNKFYDINFTTIAVVNSDGKFLEGTAVNALSATVKVGDTLTLTNLRLYATSAKQIQLNTGMQSIVIDPDTSQSVIVKVVTQFYDTNNQLSMTSQGRYQLNSNGNVKELSSKMDLATGQTETWIYD